MPPRFWTGDITPDSLKAMILQVDDDDDEAEQKIRISVEQRSARNLRRVFNDMLDTLHPEGFGEWQDPNIAAERVRARFREEQALYEALSQAIQDGADLGVSVAFRQLQNIGMAFDYTLVHTEARAWAAQYTGQLISNIGDTTADGVRQAVTRWIDSGMPLEALIQDLQPYFGRQRAELIAATEVTQAYAQGTLRGYRESGVVEQVEWRTASDERVCPVCGPLHGTRTTLDGDFDGYFPPAHPRCRCWIVGVVPDRRR